MNSYSKAGEAIKRLEDILKDYSINESVIRHDL